MKTWTISLAFNDISIIEDSIAQFYATWDRQIENEHVIVDNHWPINYPEHRDRLRALCARFGIAYLDANFNRGLHHGWNFAWSRMNIPDNAAVIGYDLDSWPVTYGWNMAIAKAFMADPTIGWFSLWHQHAQRELMEEGRCNREARLDGVHVRYVRSPCMNSVCAFRQKYLREVGGLYEQLPKYGGLECDMWEKLRAYKYEWVFLPDFKEEPHFCDRVNPLYREYKWVTTHGKQQQVDFVHWLKLRKR